MLAFVGTVSLITAEKSFSETSVSSLSKVLFILVLTALTISSGEYGFGIVISSEFYCKAWNSFLSLYSPTPIIPLWISAK